MKRKFFCFFLSILLLTALAGCGKDIPAPDDSEIRALTTQMLDGILTGDYDACRAALCREIPDRDVRALCEQGRDYLPDISGYELDIVQWNLQTVNGIREFYVRYRMTAQEHIYYVDVRTVSDTKGLYNFHVNSEADLAEATKVTVTGTLATFRDSDGLQKCLLIFGLAEFAFVVFSAVYCLRKKPKRRWLWLLLIVLASALIRFVIANGSYSTHLHAGIYLALTSLLRDSTGITEFRLFIPVGALLIWILRPWKKPVSTSPPVQMPSEEAPDS